MKTFLVILTALLVSSCSSTRTQVATSPWYGDNEAKLNAMIKQHGNTGNNYDARHRPVAVFDWDNTVLKNDASDATFFWIVSHDLIKTPQSWKKTSPLLTKKALQRLKQTCGNLRPGQVILTTQNAPCADLLLSIWDEGKLPASNESAWTTHSNSDTMKPACAWLTALLAGYTPEQVHAFTQAAMLDNLGQATESKQQIGSHTYTHWVRFYSQMKDLIKNLQQNGFDVWIVSASPQPIVEVYANEVGIKSDHVIGVRALLSSDEVYTTDLEGCGTHADKSNSLITFRQGKRCFINKVIFGMTDPKQMMTQQSRTVFAAGDSDTDVFFVKDAKYHLVINRNNLELMCNAYANRDGNWMINPMFIGAKPQKKGAVTGEPAYSCEKFGLQNQAIDTVF